MNMPNAANSAAASACPQLPMNCSRMLIAPPSTRAVWPKDDAHRLDEDQQIKERRIILGIIEVIFQLVPGILDRSAIGIVDLRPARDARLHHMAFRIVTQMLLQILDELAPFGA